MLTALNIKPVMGAEEGVIIKLDQARGINKGAAAYVRYCSQGDGGYIWKTGCDLPCKPSGTRLYVKAELEKRASFKEIVITEAAGVATVYAMTAGIILAM